MNPPQHILLFGIRAYQVTLSPLKNTLFGPGAGCRHTPTCSNYALTAVRRHGALRGSWLSLKRLLRCHPWGSSGYDPVPETRRPHSDRSPGVDGTRASRSGPKPDFHS